MVIKRALWAAILIYAALPALAKSAQEQMFPGATSCYARSYSKDHLAKHPEQRVTKIAVMPDHSTPSPRLGLRLLVTLRGVPGGDYEAFAYCENEGVSTLYCSMEGDSGGFQITPAKKGAVLITVSSLGMGFENEDGFITLERSQGDDRSFILQSAVCR